MIYVGIDDTDTLDDPGTNQLARHLVRALAGSFTGRMIVRHQLLEDPRVPCTRKNGCASILFEPIGPATADQLTDQIRQIMKSWCPRGSDPGLCVAHAVPPPVVEWGQRCKCHLTTQAEARRLASEHGIHLEGLGGTEDGVIGALAAIGLFVDGNDGRIVYLGPANEDWYDVAGCLSADEIRARGVDEIRILQSGKIFAAGTIDIGKRLRPNRRGRKSVLFVTRNENSNWEAARIT